MAWIEREKEKEKEKWLHNRNSPRKQTPKEAPAKYNQATAFCITNKAKKANKVISKLLFRVKFFPCDEKLLDSFRSPCIYGFN